MHIYAERAWVEIGASTSSRRRDGTRDALAVAVAAIHEGIQLATTELGAEEQKSLGISLA